MPAAHSAHLFFIHSPTSSPNLFLDQMVCSNAYVGLPERREIAAQRFFVVNVAYLAEDRRPQGVLGNAADAAELDPFDHLGSGPGWLRRNDVIIGWRLKKGRVGGAAGG